MPNIQLVLDGTSPDSMSREEFLFVTTSSNKFDLKDHRKRRHTKTPFNVTVTYQYHDSDLKTEQMKGVEKVKWAFVSGFGKTTEVFVVVSKTTTTIWEASTVRHVSMVPER